MHSSAQLSASVASVEITIGRFSGLDIILKDRQSFICRGPLMRSLPAIVPVLATELKVHIDRVLEKTRRKRMDRSTGPQIRLRSQRNCNFDYLCRAFPLTRPKMAGDVCGNTAGSCLRHTLADSVAGSRETCCWTVPACGQTTEKTTGKYSTCALRDAIPLTGHGFPDDIATLQDNVQDSDRRGYHC